MTGQLLTHRFQKHGVCNLANVSACLIEYRQYTLVLYFDKITDDLVVEVIHLEVHEMIIMINIILNL